MNHLVLLFLITAIVSCGKKNTLESDHAKIQTFTSDLKRFQDFDNDHINDFEESKIDKIISNTPKLSIESMMNFKINSVNSINPETNNSTYYEYKENESRNDNSKYIRQKLMKLSTKKINGIPLDNKDLISIQDEDKKLIYNIKPETKLKLQSNLIDLIMNKKIDQSSVFDVSFDFKINIENSYKDDLIFDLKSDFILNDIIIASRVINRNNDPTIIKSNKNHYYTDFYNYFIKINNLSLKEYKAIVLNPENLIIKFNNFSYNRNNKIINKEFIREKNKEKMSRVIISTPNKTKIYYVIPKSNISNFLKKLDPKLKENSYRSTHMFMGLQNSTNFKGPKSRDETGRWISHGITSNSDALEAGNDYYLTYITRENYERHNKQNTRKNKVTSKEIIQKEYLHNELHFIVTKTIKQFTDKEISVKACYKTNVIEDRGDRSRSVERTLCDAWCGVKQRTFSNMKEITLSPKESLKHLTTKRSNIEDLKKNKNLIISKSNSFISVNLDKAISLQLLRRKKESTTTGYIGYGNCNIRHHRGFEFESYRPNKQTVESTPEYNILDIRKDNKIDNL